MRHTEHGDGGPKRDNQSHADGHPDEICPNEGLDQPHGTPFPDREGERKAPVEQIHEASEEDDISWQSFQFAQPSAQENHGDAHDRGAYAIDPEKVFC